MEAFFVIIRAAIAKFSRGFVQFCPPKLPQKFLEMIVFIAAIDFVKFSSKSELSSNFFGRLKFLDLIYLKTLNGRLPLEDGSDRPETLGKRISDDSRHFIFRRRKKIDDNFTLIYADFTLNYAKLC